MPLVGAFVPPKICMHACQMTKGRKDTCIHGMTYVLIGNMVRQAKPRQINVCVYAGMYGRGDHIYLLVAFHRHYS